MFNAFIRTHHMTSRKKIARIRKAAKCISYGLIRSGGCPGLMYAEGTQQGVTEWVATVQALRYKDYQLVRKPAPVEESGCAPAKEAQMQGFEEVDSVAVFAAEMEKRGILQWWRSAMGFGEKD